MIPFQDQLKIISSCPVCNTKNFPAQVKILTEKADAHLLHIKCRKCQSCVLVLVRFDAQGLVSIGLLTDLNSEEVVKFSQTKQINCNDILRLYDSLNSNSQEFFEQCK